jgi:hypothetical protein
VIEFVQGPPNSLSLSLVGSVVVVAADVVETLRMDSKVNLSKLNKEK